MEDRSEQDDQTPVAKSQDRTEGETDWQRRKRLAAVFGDVLPEITSDERGERDGRSDEWYRSQRPPHHGG
ncbi:MAG: hypothetical protein L0H93_22195 [Nocardioides sp.]|nr:hypothetical protein [Nocardioides sp.]